MYGLPASIPVGGLKIRLCWKASLPGDDWGYYDHDKKTIFLSKKLPEEDRIPTILHEAFHASLAISGLNEMMSSKLQEALVRHFDSILLPSILKVVGVDLKEYRG